jgi:predicted ribosomally synthesized peptide with nif11-like leader
MSQQALDAFKTKLAEDEALRKEMATTLSAGGTKNTASMAEVIAFAKSKGFDINAEELRQTAELSDAELDRVAGGATTDYYLKLDGLSGSTYKEQIDIYSWSWGVR